MRQIAVVSDYAELIAALRARAEALDVTNMVLGEIAGLSPSHVGRVLAVNAPQRVEAFSLLLLSQAMGLKFAILEDEQAMERLARISHTIFA
jgi:hypothetical protein